MSIVGLASPVLDARGVVRHLRRGWGILLLGGLAGVAAALLALALVVPRYTSTLEILLDQASLNVIDNDILARRPQYDAGMTQADTQARVIHSDSVLRDVVRRLGLAADPEFAAAGWLDRALDATARALGTDPGPGPDPEQTALEALRRVVTVRRADRTLIIDVRAETRDAETSARIVNAIGDAFIRAEAANRAGLARRLSGSMGDGLAGLKAAVEDVEARILRYRQENGLVSADGKPLSDSRLSALNQQLVTAEIRRAEARERLDQARRARPEEAGAALPEMLQSRELRSLRQQEASLSRSTAELAARLGSRHPAFLEQAAQERDVKRQSQREKERIVDSLQRDADRAVAAEAAIRTELAAARAEVTENDRAEVGLRELNRELAARRTVYEASLRRTREIGAQERVDSSRIRVISPATPAAIPTWPPARKPILIQAFALGLALAALYLLVRGSRADGRRFAAAFLRGDGEPLRRGVA